MMENIQTICFHKHLSREKEKREFLKKLILGKKGEKQERIN